MSVITIPLNILKSRCGSVTFALPIMQIFLRYLKRSSFISPIFFACAIYRKSIRHAPLIYRLPQIKVIMDQERLNRKRDKQNENRRNNCKRLLQCWKKASKACDTVKCHLYFAHVLSLFKICGNNNVFNKALRFLDLYTANACCLIELEEKAYTFPYTIHIYCYKTLHCTEYRTKPLLITNTKLTKGRKIISVPF